MIGFVIYAIGSFICGCAITLTLAWLLFLTLLVLLTYMLFLSIYVEVSLDKVQSINEEAFINGGIQAEETINAIRVVKAFRQEKMCSSEFSSHLEKNKIETMGMACRYGTAFACIESIPYSFLGYALLVGGFFVAERVRIFLNFYKNLIDCLSQFLLYIQCCPLLSILIMFIGS